MPKPLHERHVPKSLIFLAILIPTSGCRPYFPQELGFQIKQTAADSLYDLFGERALFQSGPTCRSMSAKARRNHVERRECNRIKSNLAPGFKP